MAMAPYKRRVKRGKIKKRITPAERLKLERDRKRNKVKLQRDRKKYYRKNKNSIKKRQERHKKLTKNKPKQVKNKNFRYSYS